MQEPVVLSRTICLNVQLFDKKCKSLSHPMIQIRYKQFYDSQKDDARACFLSIEVTTCTNLHLVCSFHNRLLIEEDDPEMILHDSVLNKRTYLG